MEAECGCTQNPNTESGKRSGRSIIGTTMATSMVMMMTRGMVMVGDMDMIVAMMTSLRGTFSSSRADGLGLWVPFHVARTSKVATIMSWRNFQCPLKNIAHRIDVSKAALASNSFHAVVTFFQSPASCFDAEALHKLRGRGLHLLGKDPGEIARTHPDSLRQYWHVERFV